jgi:hypothetical protein
MNKIIKTPQAKQDLIDLASCRYNAAPASDASGRFLAAAENDFSRLADFAGVGAAHFLPRHDRSGSAKRGQALPLLFVGGCVRMNLHTCRFCVFRY